jgi:DNA-binding NarL/FixJ family response regulator
MPFEDLPDRDRALRLAAQDGARSSSSRMTAHSATGLTPIRQPSYELAKVAPRDELAGPLWEPVAAATWVGVCDSCPARGLGIVTALEHAGLRAEELPPAALPRWVAGPAPRAVVACLEDPGELDGIGRLRACNRVLPIVALLPVLTPELARTALLAGATGVGALNAPLSELARLVVAALSGHALLSQEMASALARPAPRGGALGHLNEAELSILRALVAGATVAELARAAAFSEREMHRRLRRLYVRMGVRDRAQALVAAVQHGLTDNGEPG